MRVAGPHAENVRDLKHGRHAHLLRRRLCALEHRTQPVSAVRVDLCPQVGREVHGAALQLFALGLGRSPALSFRLFHGAIVVPLKTT